jgi:hypothetical protein
MRRIAAILFSFFLVYAGVAYASEACLHHNGHSHDAFQSHHAEHQALAKHDHSPSPSQPIIHCPRVEKRLGPALPVASPKLERLHQVTLVRTLSLPSAAPPTFRNSLWLEALFKRTLTFSLPNDFARHLFLSILQI